MATAASWKERIWLIEFALAALALGSGVTDVVAFLTVGDVFTSAMTGNTALLGIALSQGQILAASHSFLALFGFTLGASLASVIYLIKRSNRVGKLKMMRPLLLVEIGFLSAFAIILTLAGRPLESGALYGLVLFSAIGMGVQGVVARHIDSAGINTIVFTSTLVSIVVSLTSSVLRRSGGQRVDVDTKLQIGSFLAYALGAVLAGLLAKPALRVIAWVPMVAVVAALGCCEAAANGQRNSR